MGTKIFCFVCGCVIGLLSTYLYQINKEHCDRSNIDE